MLRLLLLGALEVDGPDVTRHQIGVTRRPGHVALLAYLALAGRAFSSRDLVQALFWPEHDHPHARHNLNQWLYALRRTLGGGVVVSRGAAAIGLSSDHLWCDAAALLDALDADNRALALDLYRGDLLPGFHLPSAPPFQEWLDGKRRQLRRRVGLAALDHAVEEEQHGRVREAAAAARRAAELTSEELVVQAVIRLLDRLGDRSSAVLVFREFRRRLARDLDLDPSPETIRVVRALEGRSTPHR